jgi:hypothetical protein
MSILTRERGQKMPCPRGRAGTSGRDEVLGKGVRKVIWHNEMCTHVSKCKMVPVETTSGIGGWRG